MKNGFIALLMLLLPATGFAQDKLWVEKSSKKTSASSVVKLTKRVSPAVVNVIVTFGSSLSGILDGPFSESSLAQGTGFIINSNGLMLTNAHVVENATRRAASEIRW